MSEGESSPADSLRAQLEATQGPVFYSDLLAHLQRDAVLVVDPGLALATAALAVALNKVAVVQQWLGAGLLRKPGRDELERWSSEHTQRFVALVVQPFVLVHAP